MDIENDNLCTQFPDFTIRLKVSPSEAEALLAEVTHRTFQTGLQKYWKPYGDGRVPAYSICWLFCWAKIKREPATTVQRIWDNIFDHNFSWLDLRLEHEIARELRKTPVPHNIEALFTQTISSKIPPSNQSKIIPHHIALTSMDDDIDESSIYQDKKSKMLQIPSESRKGKTSNNSYGVFFFLLFVISSVLMLAIYGFSSTKSGDSYSNKPIQVDANELVRQEEELASLIEKESRDLDEIIDVVNVKIEEKDFITALEALSDLEALSHANSYIVALNLRSELHSMGSFSFLCQYLAGIPDGEWKDIMTNGYITVDDIFSHEGLDKAYESKLNARFGTLDGIRYEVVPLKPYKRKVSTSIQTYTTEYYIEGNWLLEFTLIGSSAGYLDPLPAFRCKLSPAMKTPLPPSGNSSYVRNNPYMNHPYGPYIKVGNNIKGVKTLSVDLRTDKFAHQNIVMTFDKNENYYFDWNSRASDYIQEQKASYDILQLMLNSEYMSYTLPHGIPRNHRSGLSNTYNVSPDLSGLRRLWKHAITLMGYDPLSTPTSSIKDYDLPIERILVKEDSDLDGQ